LYKLLIVDDEHIEREALKYVVTRACMHVQVVDVAVNGYDAIEKAKVYKPDILFIDIKMPGINGIDTAKEIIAMNKGCKIIFVSAFDYFHYAQKAIEVGAIDYILKPVSNEQLVQSIDRATKLLDSERNQQLDNDTSIVEEPARDNNGPMYPLEKERQLYQRIVMDDEDGASQLIDELYEWIVLTSLNIDEIRTKAFSLLVSIRRAILQDALDEQSRYYNRLQVSRNLDDIRLNLKNIASEIHKELTLHQIDRTGLLIGRTCEYINANYMKEIRLEEMAGMINYSSHYFSKMFKLYKSQNFIDYITTVRVGKAKELLVNNQLSIKEVSGLVGYEDQNYFTRVFKRMENMTPSEFRDKIVIVNQQ